VNLWEFSLTLYPKPGVADACLTLQNHHGADVNVLLYLLWTASAGKAPNVTQLTEMLALSAEWRQRVVAPLRSLRSEMKGWPLAGTLPEFSQREDFETLRAAVKAAELEAEKRQQRVLESRFGLAGLIDDGTLAVFADSILQLFPNPETASASYLVHSIAVAHDKDFGARVCRALNLE
jgi:uncharacterized protein (TIGR02444 family)